MDILITIGVLFICLSPAAVVVTLTNASKKRGCGRGCAHCGNREICHRHKKSKPKH